MTFMTDFPGMLALHERALRMQGERRWFWRGLACYAAGFLAYSLVRIQVYASLPEITAQPAGPFGFLLHIHLVQTLLFLSAVYVPGVILLGNAIAGRGITVSGKEYRIHVSALLPLWGILFLVAAPVQWIAPHFLVIGVLEVSVGMLVRSILIGVYTVWAVKHLNLLTAAQAIGVFILSWFALPLYFLMVRSIYFLAFFVAIPLACLLYRRLRKSSADPATDRVSRH
jgi:hypothetical protein